MYEDFNRILDAYRDQMKKDLEELIRIPSVLDLESAGEGAPFGKGVQDALDWIIGKASAMGFETKKDVYKRQYQKFRKYYPLLKGHFS